MFRKFCDLSRLIPEQHLPLLVKNARIWSRLTTTSEISTGDAFEVGRECDEERRLTALVDRLEEELKDSERYLETDRIIPPDSRVRKARMKSVARDVEALESLCKLQCEHDGGELWVAVELTGKPEVDRIKIFRSRRLKRRHVMILWRHDDNLRRSRSLYHTDQKMRQQERPIVVGRHRQLNPIDALRLLKHSRISGIVNQHIESGFVAQKLLRKIPHRLLRTQIQSHHDNTLIAGLSDNLICNGR